MITLPEQLSDRLESLKALLKKVLPDFEYRYFLSNPLGYVSANFVFRGMSMNKYSQLISDNYIFPKPWDLAWGEAVFTTNKISEALGYVEWRSSWAIAVIPRKWIEWRTLHKNVLIWSSRYQAVIAELLSHSNDSKYVYTVDNQIDLERRQSQQNWDHRMLMIRLPQDHRKSGMRFLIWDGNSVFLE